MKHETRKILDKIKYEKVMFQFTAQYLLDHQYDNCPIHGAILESFLIHARIIHEFIIKESYQDDIKANELVDNISLWEEKKNNLFSNLGISKEIGGVQYRHGWYDLKISCWGDV